MTDMQPVEWLNELQACGGASPVQFFNEIGALFKYLVNLNAVSLSAARESRAVLTNLIILNQRRRVQPQVGETARAQGPKRKASACAAYVNTMNIFSTYNPQLHKDRH